MYSKVLVLKDLDVALFYLVSDVWMNEEEHIDVCCWVCSSGVF